MIDRAGKEDPLDFGASAIYRVAVQGVVPESYNGRFSGMKVCVVQESTQGSNRTILEGRMIDQVQLNGVLDTLCKLHLPILSVERI